MTFNPTDLGFSFGEGASSSVNSVAVQSDGKILIGGNFTTYNGTASTRIARLNADGSLDNSFDPGTGANNLVRSVAVQSDGKILIGGDFTTYNGTGRNYIARLNADGSLDGTFDPGTGANGSVRSVVVQSDGKILIGGSFTTYNGTGRNYIARLNADGSLDISFTPGTGASAEVNSVAVQSDGKILIGGNFTTYNGTARSGIARLNTDGSLDTSFTPGTGANNTVNSVAVQSDGKILIGGAFSNYNGTARSRIARLNAAGTLDVTFTPGTGANLSVQSVAVQSDGKILIGGDFTSYNGTARIRIARLNAVGTLDISFTSGTGASSTVYSVAVQSDGKILIGGSFTTYIDTPRGRIARLNADGTLEGTFNPGTGANAAVFSVAVQSDGKILIGGDFTTYNGTPRNRIARLNADGTLDTSFDPGTGASGTVRSFAVQSDGKILIGGSFTTYNGTGRTRIARLNADGSLDGTFTPGTGAGNLVSSVAVQSDGKILIGGAFTTYDGTARSCIARLNADGSLDGTFDPGTGASGTSASVQSVAVQSDGKILIGGFFTTYNGTGRNYIARLNAVGTLDGTFTPGTGANNSVRSIVVQSDGKILIGGDFTSYNGTGRNYIARLNAVGTLDGTFDPGTGANSSVQSVAVQSDGKFLIGGFFTTYNGTGRNYIARLNAVGTLDGTFDPGTGATSEVRFVAILSDDKILIGGAFTSYNGTGRNRVARLLNPCTNPISGGTIAAAQSGSSPFDPAAFTSSVAASGHSGTLEYKWQSSTTSNTTGFSDIASSNSDVYDPGSLTQTTWYKRLARVSCQSNWTGAAESNVLEVTVASMAAEPTAQPTALYFTTTGTSPTFNLVGRFTAAASTAGYLVVRNTGSAPTFTPADGTAYTAGSQTGGTVVYAGSATDFTESSVTLDLNYNYAIYAYNGSGSNTNYLTTSPLTGMAFARSAASGTLTSSGASSTLGFPGAGATVNFPAGTSGTTLNVTKNNSAPSSNIQVSSSIRGMKPVYFSITSSTASPGSYTLILDFSSLGTLTPTQWNSYKITKRANASSPWVDVTTLGATIVNRQTDGVWGKFTITGLSSFSEFGLAEVYDGVVVSNLDQTIAGSFTVTSGDYAGQSFTTDGIRYQLTKVKVSASANQSYLRARLYGSASDGGVNTSALITNFGTPTLVSGSVYELTPSSTVKLEPNTRYWLILYSSNASALPADFVSIDYTSSLTESGPASFPTNLSASSGNAGSTYTLMATDPALFSIEATEVSRTWTGTSTTDWATAGNWTPSEIPGSGEILTIPNVANDPVLPANTSVAYLTIASGAVVDLADKILTVTHGLSHAGTMTSTTGKLIMAGTAAQGIEGTGTIRHLEVNNSAGVTIFAGSHMQTITGKLTPTSGTLTTNGNLTLRSSATGTARVGQGASGGGYISGDVITQRYLSKLTGTGRNGRAWRLVTIPVTGTGTLRDVFMAGQSGTDLTVSGNRSAQPSDLGTVVIGHNQPDAATATGAGYDWIGTAGQVSSLRSYAESPASGSFASSQVPSLATTYTSAAQGYMLFARGDRQQTYNGTGNSSATVLQATGALKQGTINVAIPTLASAGFVLVGNPYMAVLDLEKVILDNATVIDNTVYIWDANIDGNAFKQGGYRAVTRTGVSNWTASGAGANPQYIESGSAFFVKPTASGGTLSIKEAHKVDGTPGIAPHATMTDGPSRLFINLEVTDTANRRLVDGAVAFFDTNYKDALGDAVDIAPMTNLTVGSITLRQSGVRLSMEGRPWPADSAARTIPVDMRNLGDDAYVLRILPTNMNKEGFTAWLKDRHLNQETSLKTDDETLYPFRRTGDLGIDSSRFEIVYRLSKPTNAGTLTPDDAAGEIGPRLYPNPAKSADVKLSLGSLAPGRYEVQVLDISGRAVMTRSIEHNSVHTAHRIFQGQKLAPGQYIVRISSNDRPLHTLQLTHD